jgi:hypothetical protein
MRKNHLTVVFAVGILASGAFVSAAIAVDSTDQPSASADVTATAPEPTASASDNADAAFAKKRAVHHVVVHRRPSQPASSPAKVVRVASRIQGRMGGCSLGCSGFLVLGVGF